MIEPLRHSPLISLGCTKGSKHGGESLAGEVRAGAPLKPAARDLKPDADDDICGQLHVLYGHSSLGNRLGKVRLEIFANPAERSRGHCQTNLSGPAKGAGLRRSGRQLTPLRQGGRTVLFEDVAAIEVTVVVEVVVD